MLLLVSLTNKWAVYLALELGRKLGGKLPSRVPSRNAVSPATVGPIPGRHKQVNRASGRSAVETELLDEVRNASLLVARVLNDEGKRSSLAMAEKPRVRLRKVEAGEIIEIE